jgi:hypothetical protein
MDYGMMNSPLKEVDKYTINIPVDFRTRTQQQKVLQWISKMGLWDERKRVE